MCTEISGCKELGDEPLRDAAIRDVHQDQPLTVHGRFDRGARPSAPMILLIGEDIIGLQRGFPALP